MKRSLMQTFSLLCIMLLVTSAHTLQSQDDTPYRSRVSLNCTQMANNNVDLIAKVRAKIGRSYVAVKDAEVEFYSATDTSEVLLGKTTTNIKGLAFLNINSKETLTSDEEGYYNVIAKYKGDDTHKADDDDLAFKPGFIELTAEEIDSVKTIIVQLNTEEEDPDALDELEVKIQVPRMFSNLTIATEYLDEDGRVEIEFPDDLPGGENGELEIISYIEDTDDYGSLKNEISNNWGSMIEHESASNERELWSPNAPLWMVLTFALLISLVWAHFLIIIYKLFLINKEGKALSKIETE